MLSLKQSTEINHQTYPTHKLLIFLVIIVPLASSLHLQTLHEYYSLQSSFHVQNSSSMIELTKCQQKCLKMKNYLPFYFRFHSIIYRQPYGLAKYFVGNCQAAINKNSSFISWKLLKNQIYRQYLITNNIVQEQQQILLWNVYNSVCQNPSLKLTNSLRKSLGLVHIYSDFLYYDNGSFINLRPFNLTGLLQNITKALGG